MSKTQTNTELPDNPFKTLDDVINDAVFKHELEKKLSELKYKRKFRPVPGRGLRYKRDWYDHLEESNSLNVEFFLTNIKDIWLKQSQLNSETRSVILLICNQSLNETLLKYKTAETLIKTNNE